MTELYDCFGIESGDKNVLGWIGAIGAAKLIENEDGYLRVKGLIKPDKQKNLPPWEGKKPERQEITFLDENGEPDDGSPF